MTSPQIRVQPQAAPAGGPDRNARVTRSADSRVQFVLGGHTEYTQAAYPFELVEAG